MVIARLTVQLWPDVLVPWAETARFKAVVPPEPFATMNSCQA